MSTLKAYKTFFHVLYSRKDHTWRIKKDDSDTIIAYSSKSKELAIQKAIELAEASTGKPREVIIHKTNGAFGKIKSIIE